MAGRVGRMLAGVVLVMSAVVSPPTSASAAPGDEPCPATAAGAFGWPEPVNGSDFTDPASLQRWHLYDSVGHGGNGRRTPDAISVADGQMTISGDPFGNSGGMALLPGALYGRWEVCAKVPPGSPNYHAVLLLWPDSENWPADGEIDFMEILDPSRQTVTATLHHLTPIPGKTFGPADFATVSIDATAWHSWAVEWTPGRVAGFVDGVQWFEMVADIPSTPMHLCMQLDDFGGDISQGGQLMVAWTREFGL